MPEKLGSFTKKEVVRLTSIQLSIGDKKLLDYVCNFLGCSQAEAVRAGIRAMAAQIQQVEKRSSP